LAASLRCCKELLIYYFRNSSRRAQILLGGKVDRMSQDEMEHLIAAAGYHPRQRTNLYERLVTREETADLARRYRHALTPENRDLASAPLLPVLA
jgi:hypothetical protein